MYTLLSIHASAGGNEDHASKVIDVLHGKKRIQTWIEVPARTKNSLQQSKPGLLNAGKGKRMHPCEVTITMWTIL